LVIGLERSTHPSERTEQPRLHGAERDPQHFGRLGQREAQVVVEDDDRPLVRRETLEPAGQQITGFDLAREVRRFQARDVDDVDFDSGPLSLPGGDAVAGPDEQSMQPGVEPVRVAQAPDVLPRSDERVLDDVLGQRTVAQDQPGRLVQAVRPADRQRRKRVKVALLRPLDKLSLDRRVSKRGSS
jgi:hypothetical protein